MKKDNVVAMTLSTSINKKPARCFFVFWLVIKWISNRLRGNQTESLINLLHRYQTWYFHSLMTSTFWRQNILRHFTRSAPPLLYSWSGSPIGCSTPLYSRSGSLIRSAYYFLYIISFCFRFNKSLTNLTSLRQHHLQYKGSWWTDAKICFIAST